MLLLLLLLALPVLMQLLQRLPLMWLVLPLRLWLPHVLQRWMLVLLSLLQLRLLLPLLLLQATHSCRAVLLQAWPAIDLAAGAAEQTALLLMLQASDAAVLLAERAEGAAGAAEQTKVPTWS